MKIEQSERRREKRVTTTGQVSLGASHVASTAVLRNVSLNGILCQSTQELAEMTVVELKLELPRLAEERADTRYELECRGVVVRCEPVARGNSRRRWDIAIYFTDMPEASRAALERFVQVRKE